MVSGVCLCYNVSPYAIICKSFDFRVMNIYKKILKFGEQIQKNVV